MAAIVVLIVSCIFDRWQSLRPKQNEALVEFAGSLAHELANIFTAAAGNLSFLGGGLIEDKNDLSAIEDIRRSHERGFALSDRLKAVSSRQALNSEDAGINQELAQVAQEARASFPREIVLVTRFDKNACIAFIDREKFRAAILELLANAREAMPGGGRITIETSIERAEVEFIRIGIGDTGKGMAPEFAARAFDPLVTTKAQNFHNGWGLSICEGFVRQSGGFMQIASALGRGTCVSVFLPLSAPA